MATGSALGGWLHRVTDSDIWWSFKSSPMTVTAAAATFFIIAVAFLSPVLAPHTPFDPATLSLSDGLKPPVLLSSDGDWTFPLGTDDQGRDKEDGGHNFDPRLPALHAACRCTRGRSTG